MRLLNVDGKSCFRMILLGPMKSNERERKIIRPWRSWTVYIKHCDILEVLNLGECYSEVSVLSAAVLCSEQF